jgi:plastocyanin
MTTARPGRLPTTLLALVVPLVAAAAVIVTLSATPDPTVAAATGRGASGPGTVRIANFRYAPDPLTVQAGARVTVTNDDGTVHTLTADDGSFDTGDLDGGASATLTLSEPGTYRYFCAIHNYMTGTIEVR